VKLILDDEVPVAKDERARELRVGGLPLGARDHEQHLRAADALAGRVTERSACDERVSGAEGPAAGLPWRFVHEMELDVLVGLDELHGAGGRDGLLRSAGHGQGSGRRSGKADGRPDYRLDPHGRRSSSGHRSSSLQDRALTAA
jgi:hypothetical protein